MSKCATCGDLIEDFWFYASKAGEVNHLGCYPKDDVPADDVPHDGGNMSEESLLGLATTKELIAELHARAEVSDTIGERWPSYRTVDRPPADTRPSGLSEAAQTAEEYLRSMPAKQRGPAARALMEAEEHEWAMDTDAIRRRLNERDVDEGWLLNTCENLCDNLDRTRAERPADTHSRDDVWTKTIGELEDAHAFLDALSVPEGPLGERIRWHTEGLTPTLAEAEAALVPWVAEEALIEFCADRVYRDLWLDERPRGQENMKSHMRVARAVIEALREKGWGPPPTVKQEFPIPQVCPHCAQNIDICKQDGLVYVSGLDTVPCGVCGTHVPAIRTKAQQDFYSPEMVARMEHSRNCPGRPRDSASGGKVDG